MTKKSILAMLFTLLMFLSVGTSTFAESGTTGTGKQNEEIPQEALEFQLNEEDMVKDISVDDDLEAYGLTVDSNGEIVSLPEEANNLASARSAVSSDSEAVTAAATFYYPGTNIAARKGDILVTSDTVSFGIAGHVGIVTSTNLMHFAGDSAPGPRPQALSTWFNNRTTTKVIRVTNSTIVTNAAEWAAQQRAQNWDYKITGGISLLDPNYCSKFVFQAFNRGNGYQVLNHPMIQVTNYVLPYQFLESPMYGNAQARAIFSKGFIPAGDM